MTDEDKALVERLRDFVIAEDIDLAADRIEALSAENEQLHGALQEVISELEQGYVTCALESAKEAMRETK